MTGMNPAERAVLLTSVQLLLVLTKQHPKAATTPEFLALAEALKGLVLFDSVKNVQDEAAEKFLAGYNVGADMFRD